MANVKTILFVTYGGGHARMITPVMHELEGDGDIRMEALALTTGAPHFKSERLPFKGFKDFITPDDKEAINWGKKLAEEHHNPDSGLEEDESIAYLGLSYWDLVVRIGEEEAARLWDTKGRQAFLPLTVMERVIGQLKPDMVVTTNSPRSERAALEVAQALGIVTVCMVDLFGYVDFHVLGADYFTVLNERVIDNLLASGVEADRERFFVTGNPAFDPICNHRGPVDTEWRQTHFPNLPPHVPCVLWIDTPGYIHPKPPHLWIRSEKEILFDLENVARATAENRCALLVRPHPSQGLSFHKAWVEQAPTHVYFAGSVPLYPLLNAVDVVVAYASTVTVQALSMQRRVIQLKYKSGDDGMPLADWGMAWQAEGPDELPQRLYEALNDEREWRRKQARIIDIAPLEAAAPQVACHIRRLLRASE
jgi:hypothetical protein